MAKTQVKSDQIADQTIATADVGNNQITVGKIQQVSSNTILGRVSSGTGDVEVLTQVPETALSTTNSKNESQSLLISTADSKATAASGGIDSVARSKADSAATLDSTSLSTSDSKTASSVSVADSKNDSQSQLVSIADSKAVSDSVVVSTLQTTSDSKNTSQSVNISTADSKAASVATAAPTGSGANTQVAFWNGTNTLTGLASFTFDNITLTVPSALKIGGLNYTEWANNSMSVAAGLDFAFYGGDSTGAYAAGNMTFWGGNAAGAGAGGNFYMSAGNSASGAGGNIVLTPGQGGASNGTLKIVSTNGLGTYTIGVTNITADRQIDLPNSNGTIALSETTSTADSSVLATSNSKDISQSTNVSTADSKAVSDSVVISTLQTTSDSKALSLSTVASTNLTTVNSKDISQSTNVSTADSKAVSAASGTNDSVARSQAVSAATLDSTSSSTADSKNTSQSTNVSTADSKAVSDATQVTGGYVPYTGGSSDVDLGAHNLTVGGISTTIGANGGASSSLILNSAAATYRSIGFQTAGSNRWLVRANVTAEGGSDAGSDLEIVARHDDGTLIGNALVITRSTMAAIFGGTMLSVGGDAVSGPSFRINGAAATMRDIHTLTGGVARWTIRTDNSAESGSDAGSNFQLISRTDAGAALFTVMSAYRSTGQISFPVTTDTSSSGTGAVIFSGGIGVTKTLNVGTTIGVGVAAVSTSGLKISNASIGASIYVDDAGTNNIPTAIQLVHNSSDTPAAGFGIGIVWYLNSTTTDSRGVGRDLATWATATDASRKARRQWTVYDTAEREGLRIEASGTAPMIGFLGANAVARPSAYTQTYSTADKTHANSTYAAPSGGATVDTQCRASLAQLATDVVDVKQLINAVIDDLQALGLAG